MHGLKVLSLGDDPFERGLIHGRTFAAEARHNLETYLDRFEAGGADRARVLGEGDAWAERIAAHSPEYGVEMLGLAEGAEMPLGEVTVLNARYELTYSIFADEAGRRPFSVDGCTAFAAMPEVTAAGETIIGQNWDWLARLRGRVFVMRVTRDDKPSYLILTQAGVVGGNLGLNEAGIGLLVNGMTTAEDGREPGRRPHHVRVRDVMDAATFTEALAAVVSTDRTCSANYIIGHADGEVVDLETAPETAHAIYPEDGILTHANHFEGPQAPLSTGERVIPSTLFRGERLKRRMRLRNGPVTGAMMQELLSDHFSYPESICWHENEAVEDVHRLMTISSVIMNLNDRMMFVTDGPPCGADYEAVPLAA